MGIGYHETPPAAYNLRMLYSHGYISTDAGRVTFVYFDSDHDPKIPYQTRLLTWKEFRFDQWRGGNGWNEDWRYDGGGRAILCHLRRL